MKILSAAQIREADNYTINKEGIHSYELMERAAQACSTWIQNRFSQNHPVYIFCGCGNNGGDGFAISRQLSEQGYTVYTYLLEHTDQLSPDCERNRKLITNNFGILKQNEDIQSLNFQENALIIDAIFGSGLNRELEGLAETLVLHLNQAQGYKLSIDIATGLFADDNSSNKGLIFKADHCLSFELPKLAFLLPQTGNFVGDFSLLDIGLDKVFLLNQDSQNHFVHTAMLKPMLHRREKFSHKGSYGHAMLVAGSEGKMGAAALSTRACLRSGAGLVSVIVPKVGRNIVQNLVPEAMLRLNSGENYIEGRIDTEGFNSIAIGPGFGTEAASATSLKLLIQEARVPLVLDADALNILSENMTWMAFLPKGSILTPHPGEFRRLAGPWESDKECLKLQQELSKKYEVYILLKTAHSRVSCPDGNIYFNSTGNPGMATAGSGDTITGIIAGLLAQSYTPMQAAILGMYLHGLAGDIAADKNGHEGLIASDLIESLAQAFAALKE